MADKVERFLCFEGRASRGDVIREMGDVLFYIVKIASLHGAGLREVISASAMFERVSSLVATPRVALHVCIDAGKVVERVKKRLRGDDCSGYNEAVIKALGETLSTLSALSNRFGSCMQEVMEGNVEKLTDRKARRGTLRGDGDDR